MSDSAIEVEKLGKLYNLGEIRTSSVGQDLNRLWARLRGKEDPYAKLGAVNDRTRQRASDFVWALKDVSFDVKQGEVLGIIGRNGAGKSTLLKLLSKVTAPTEGTIRVRGRIASLLEVGTGFHPELTGRENVFLNGAILGMNKAEIRAKFDAIVDFAGVQLYIDTPVKRYSSGMYVRLAFAVAAFLEPEILVVDEVLAVGDAEFQQKCLGRMKDVSENDGRTVLFVSHDMSAVSTLTQRCVLMSQGRLHTLGPTQQTIAAYIGERKEGEYSAEPGDGPTITRVRVDTSESGMIQAHGLPMKVAFQVHLPEPRDGIVVHFRILDHLGMPLTGTPELPEGPPPLRTAGFHELEFEFEHLRLYQGRYSILAHLQDVNEPHRKLTTVACCDFEVEMLNLVAPDWGWQPTFCKYFDSGRWSYEGRMLKVQDHESK